MIKFKFKSNIDVELGNAMIRRGGEKSVRDCANLLLEESRKQVPLDTGALSRSGAVDSEGLTATVSYDTPYAVRWHETNANFQHGRKMKYLEDPCNDPALKSRMLEYLQRDLKI